MGPAARLDHRRRHAVCLTTGPQPLPKLLLHRMHSTASLSSSSILSFPQSRPERLLPRLPVISSFTSIFPSTPCSRRQFLCKKRPIQRPFHYFIVMYVPFCVFCLILFCVLFVCKSVLDYCHRDIGALFDCPN
jgi:hypothetical protein